jgi:hypothetical protein
MANQIEVGRTIVVIPLKLGYYEIQYSERENSTDELQNETKKILLENDLTLTTNTRNNTAVNFASHIRTLSLSTANKQTTKRIARTILILSSNSTYKL